MYVLRRGGVGKASGLGLRALRTLTKPRVRPSASVVAPPPLGRHPAHVGLGTGPTNRRLSTTQSPHGEGPRETTRGSSVHARSGDGQRVVLLKSGSFPNSDEGKTRLLFEEAAAAATVGENPIGNSLRDKVFASLRSRFGPSGRQGRPDNDKLFANGMRRHTSLLGPHPSEHLPEDE